MALFGQRQSKVGKVQWGSTSSPLLAVFWRPGTNTIIGPPIIIGGNIVSRCVFGLTTHERIFISKEKLVLVGVVLLFKVCVY